MFTLVAMLIFAAILLLQIRNLSKDKLEKEKGNQQGLSQYGKHGFPDRHKKQACVF
jgi:hypothetical protein